MEPLPNLINDFECLWGKITTPNSMFYVATIYYPPDHTYNPDDLIEFLSDSCEQLLLTAPNNKIIIAGDINKLNISSLLKQQSLFQMVKTPTRGDNILDYELRLYYEYSTLLEKNKSRKKLGTI